MKLLNDIIIFPYFSIPIDHKDLIRLHIFLIKSHNDFAENFAGKLGYGLLADQSGEMTGGSLWFL